MKLKGKIINLQLDYITHKPQLVIQLNNQNDVLTDEFTKLQKEEVLDINLSKYQEKRGLQPNACFHVLVNQLARHFNLSDDEMKIKMNLQYGTIATDENEKVIGCKVPKGTKVEKFYPYTKWYKEDNDGCDCYLFYKRTHTLSKKEFSQLLSGVIQECKEVGIKTPDDIEFQRLIDNYVEFGCD